MNRRTILITLKEGRVGEQVNEKAVPLPNLCITQFVAYFGDQVEGAARWEANLSDDTDIGVKF
jgi:hypothetical protein